MLCLVLRPVLRFSPCENIITDFVLTVNKPKIYQSQPKGPKTFRLLCKVINWYLNK